MKNFSKKIVNGLTLLTGLGLIFIGLRFLIVPEAAESAFGINTLTNGDYSFHYIKGVRDLSLGLIVSILLLARQYRGLAVVLIVGAIVPTVDFMIVFSHPGFETAKLFPHLTAVIICIVFGIYYLRMKTILNVKEY